MVHAQHSCKISGTGCSVILPVASDKHPFWSPLTGGNCREAVTSAFLYHSLHADRMTDDRLEVWERERGCSHSIDGDWVGCSSILIEVTGSDMHSLWTCLLAEADLQNFRIRRLTGSTAQEKLQMPTDMIIFLQFPCGEFCFLITAKRH